MLLVERKEKSLRYWNRITKRMLFFMVIAFFLFSIWKISVSGGTTPIEIRTKDGWFEAEGSQVRSIRLYVETQYRGDVVESSGFSVWITDEDGKKLWENTYPEMALKDGEFLILEEYERGEGIEIGNGRFRVQDTLSRNEDIRISYKVFFYNGGYGSFYLACSILALAALLVILALSLKNGGKYQLAIHYFLALTLMGILFSVIMPPLTVPDEESHYRKAYELSSRMLFQDIGLLRRTDNDSITYLHSASSILRWHRTFLEPADVTESVNAKWSSIPDTTPSYVYFFPALGISLARILRLNGHWAIMLGRMFNMAGVAAIMSAALYLIPFGKKYFCLLGLLPEVVYIVASYSYDGANLALCFLGISYFFYMISDGKKVRLANVLIFLGIILAMIPIKLVYAPLLGLVFLIPKNQLDINKKIIAAAGAAGAAGIMALLFMRRRDILVLLEGVTYNEGEGTRVSVKFMLENPLNVIFVFMNNMMRNFDYYLNSIAGEFVGRDRYEVLLDTSYLPQWMMIVLGSLLAMGVYTDKKAQLEPWKKAWLAFLGLSCSFLILLSLYLANNMIDMNTIHGMQGRYFLPVLLLLPGLFGRKKDRQEGIAGGMSASTYIVLASGINIVAIFVQLQHLAMDYYG